jgi:hypothetical protein
MRAAWILLCAAAVAFGQRSPEYDQSLVKQIRIDLRDLGYPPLDLIPAGESAVRALAVAPDGVLYGATSGARSHLFRLNPLHGYVEPLGWLQGSKTVHHSVAVSQSGDVYIGASNGVDNGGQNPGNVSGHLLKYEPEKRRQVPPDAQASECPVTDLGAVVDGDGIYSLTIDRERNVLYGLTYPSGAFFSYDIARSKLQIFGTVAGKRAQGEKFENEKTVARALIVDRQGDVFASGEDGFLFRFDGKRQVLSRLAVRVPCVPGREAYNRVDAWAEGQEGILYGGTSDGYLFRLDSNALSVSNLGKPLNQYRIRGLVLGSNGKFYGVGGDDDEMARLFSYDPLTGGYEMLGMIDVNHRPYYAWQAYVIDAMAVGLDGTVYLGQSERKSKLFVYYPER